MFPAEWFKANPDYQNYIPLSKESVPPEIVQGQENAIISWFTKGTCVDLSNVTQPTLVIVGTNDIWTPAANSLMIAEKSSCSMARSNKRFWPRTDVSIC
jgi:pimeloyl-ACP methyl ester carboxylesterase